eukprot:gene13476-9284_t
MGGSANGRHAFTAPHPSKIGAYVLRTVFDGVALSLLVSLPPCIQHTAFCVINRSYIRSYPFFFPLVEYISSSASPSRHSLPEPLPPLRRLRLLAFFSFSFVVLLQNQKSPQRNTDTRPNKLFRRLHNNNNNK